MLGMWIGYGLCCMVPMVFSDPWIEYCAHAWNMNPWSKVHHWDAPYPWIFNGFARNSSRLFTISLTMPVAATLTIHQIIALASNPLACFLTSLSLRLLGLALISRSMATLGSHGHWRDIRAVRVTLTCSPMASNKALSIRLSTRTPKCRTPSLLILTFTIDWKLLSGTLCFSSDLALDPWISPISMGKCMRLVDIGPWDGWNIIIKRYPFSWLNNASIDVVDRWAPCNIYMKVKCSCFTELCHSESWSRWSVHVNSQLVQWRMIGSMMIYLSGVHGYKTHGLTKDY